MAEAAARDDGADARPAGRSQTIHPERRLYGLAAHGIKRAIRAKGAHLIFLPNYSADLNLIKQLFAKLKHLMRAVQPRTAEETWRKARALIGIVRPNECSNYFATSSYPSD